MYKLVDWELSTSHADLKTRIFKTKDYNVGARAYSSPLLHFIAYGRKLDIIPFFTLMQEHFKSTFFSNEIVKINIKIKQIISDYSGSQESIFEDYNRTFDMFNLGIVVFKILAYNLKTSEEIKRDIDSPSSFWGQLLTFARKCTLSDENPYMGPSDAIQQFNVIKDYLSFEKPQTGGRHATKEKISILGRERIVHKVGRIKMVTYKHKLIPLREARRIENTRAKIPKRSIRTT
jgi:hypothetical protein